MIVTVGDWRDGMLMNPVEVCIEDHATVGDALEAADRLDAEDFSLQVGNVDVCSETALRPGDVLRILGADDGDDEDEAFGPMTVEARLERIERELGLPIPRRRS